MCILVAVANDAASTAVVGTAVGLAEMADQELYIVNLVDESVSPDTAEQLRSDIRDRMVESGVVSTVAVEPISRSSMRSGSAVGAELLNIAADVDATHIVMGHEPKGLGGRLREGDAAFAVIESAEVPVTVVPEGATGGAD
jgi:nucleotide-binding universal stress UspA family protein